MISGATAISWSLVRCVNLVWLFSQRPSSAFGAVLLVFALFASAVLLTTPPGGAEPQASTAAGLS